MPATVVIDKNFLQGASRDQVHSLMATHQLVMPGSLFFELMTTDLAARRKCFLKFPSVVNPVYLVDHIGVLLRHEIAEKRPSGLPSSHRLKFDFQFNEGLSYDSYELPLDAQTAVDAQIVDAAEDVAGLIDLSETIPDIFPVLLAGTAAQQAASLADVEALIARLEAVHEFYTCLESPDSSMPYPRIQADFGSWAHIRWLQVKMLFATDLYVRYRGRLREIATPNVLVKLEHDVHDAQILTLGVMEGSFVTREQKLQRWFRLLQPNGWVSDGVVKPGV
jgi:hypothetical protein